MEDLWIYFCIALITFLLLFTIRFIPKLIRYLRSSHKPMTIQAIQKLFPDTLSYIAKSETEMTFRQQGRMIRTQQGNYRVDFQNAVNQRLNQYYEFGINPDDAFAYIKHNHPDAICGDAFKLICEYVTAFFQSMNSRSYYEQEAAGQGVPPSAFFQAAQQMQGDMVGVYIIYNQTKNMYYVGQAKRLFFRVKQHFTGRGNGDVYADYKYGDSFLIRLVTLRESGYDDLDRLERDLIAKYHAYSHGYNKTAGNQ